MRLFLLAFLPYVAAFVAPSAKTHCMLATPTKTASPSSCSTRERTGISPTALLMADQLTKPTPDTPSPIDPPAPEVVAKGSKFRRLKDMMWLRETTEDVTAAEFACSLDDNSLSSKRAVDYDNLLAKLNKRLVDMGCSADGENCAVLPEDGGMGSYTMSLDLRIKLLA